jgi:NAD(P)-dependent dehydrogenase (short-subunit alcohol dehydrogenase family)
MAGRVVLVVGGSSGIGLAAALEFSRRHDRLVLAARSSEALISAEKQCHEAGAQDVAVVEADLSRSDGGTRAVQAATEAFGRLDVLVHTATSMAYGSVEAVPADVFEQVVDVAVHGTARLARAALPVFRQQSRGVFIVINSLLGSITVPYMGAYSTAKWGQRAVARTLQQETRKDPGIHVCIVSPGSINTPIYYQAANYLDHEARPPVPVLQPERAGTVIAELADRPRKHVSIPVGPVNPLAIAGFRFLPAVYDRIVGPLFSLAAVTSAPRGNDTGTVFEPHSDAEQVHGNWPHVV